MMKHTLYPALAAWERRERGKPQSRWTFDDLWRSAMAEWEAMHNRDNAAREREYQIEAVLALICAKSLGDPPGTRYSRIVLDLPTQRQYLRRIHERGQRHD